MTLLFEIMAVAIIFRFGFVNLLRHMFVPLMYSLLFVVQFWIQAK